MDRGLQPDVGLVLVAAGSSQRFGTGRNKLLELLHDLPVCCHPLKAVSTIVPAHSTVLVVPAGAEETFRSVLTKYGIGRRIGLVPGGNRRQASVAAGLRHLPNAVRIVAVLDAARPCSTASLLARCIESARQRGSGVAAHRLTDTIKKATPDGLVLGTADRSQLWAAETPQVFQRDLIDAAYRRLEETGDDVTDEAQAVERLGREVFLIESIAPNPKITYPVDLALLRALPWPLPPSVRHGSESVTGR